MGDVCPYSSQPIPMLWAPGKVPGREELEVFLWEHIGGLSVWLYAMPSSMEECHPLVRDKQEVLIVS